MSVTLPDPPVVVETGPNPSLCVIWLHGLGADGHDFEPIVPEMRLPVPARFVFPHAPHRPVTLNNGYVMRAWYDLAAGPQGMSLNREHLVESVQAVHALIDTERGRGFASARIVIAGFSQGGTVALLAGLEYRETLAGILCLSAPSPFREGGLSSKKRPSDTSPPVFLAHGRQDAVVPLASGEHTRRCLLETGIETHWHEYEMGHSVCGPEIADIALWLSRFEKAG